MPDSFLKEAWSQNKQVWALPLCLSQPKKICDAYLVDFDGDNKPEVLLIGTEQYIGAAVLKQEDDGHWALLGRLPHNLAGCEPLREKMQSGEFRTIPQRFQDLEIGDQRIEIMEKNPVYSLNCSGKTK